MRAVVAGLAVIFAFVGGVDYARSAALLGSKLFTTIALGCVAKSGALPPPFASVLLANKVVVTKMQTCNSGAYPVFTARFPFDPRAQTSSYFGPFYRHMVDANQGRALSFIDPDDGVVINLSADSKKVISIDYEDFSP